MRWQYLRKPVAVSQILSIGRNCFIPANSFKKLHSFRTRRHVTPLTELSDLFLAARDKFCGFIQTNSHTDTQLHRHTNTQFALSTARANFSQGDQRVEEVWKCHVRSSWLCWIHPAWRHISQGTTTTSGLLSDPRLFRFM